MPLDLNEAIAILEDATGGKLVLCDGLHVEAGRRDGKRPDYKFLSIEIYRISGGRYDGYYMHLDRPANVVVIPASDDGWGEEEFDEADYIDGASFNDRHEELAEWSDSEPISELATLPYKGRAAELAQYDVD